MLGLDAMPLTLKNLLLMKHSGIWVTDPPTHIDKLGVKTNMDHNGELEEALLNSFKETN